jgi:2,3,4,5-tetrahydropyridine-2-carboxylate N-succinyltransferase
MARAPMAEEGRSVVVPPERHDRNRRRPGGAPWWDKVDSKFVGWTAQQFRDAGFSAVPGAVVRRSAFIARGVVLMPSFVNVGAHVGENTMVDTWATIGSCAQIGKNCHISGGVGIGGVLEPLQAAPVIIEDNCFIGARSEVAEGVIVGEGSVISMGVFLGQSTKIVDRATGEIHYGRVPPYSVVVPGSLPQGPDRPALGCAVIVKRVDARTRSKTSINELLRD